MGCNVYMVMRWIVFVLLIAFTVLSIVGTVEPIYVQEIKADDQSGKVTVTLFAIKTSKVELTSPAFTVPAASTSRVNYATCGTFKSTMRAAEAFAIAGAICGFFAFLSSFVQCVFRLKMKLCMFIFTILAFISELVAVVMIGSTFSKTFCKDSFTQNASAVVFKDVGYKLSTGFILHVVSLAGFAICLILVPFTQQLWCGSC